jgi:fucose permease
MNPETFAYRRVIMIGGIFGIMASLAFGRFTLGMMLPALGETLTLSYSQMGSVGTINFCGYLGAVLLCGILSARLGRTLVLILVFVMQTLAHLLLAARLPLVAVHVSIGCFGLVVWFPPLWRH